VRFTYDGPVRVLQPSQVAAGSSLRGLSVIGFVDPRDPRSVIVRPVSGSAFDAGVGNYARLDPGFVANEDGRYAIEPVTVNVTLGRGSNAFLAGRTPPSVLELHRDALVPLAQVPTPGGVPPVGLAGSNVGGDEILWVQLAAGGPSGAPLAWFRPGDAAMTPVLVAGGATLVADRQAMVLAFGGRTMFAAFRDTATGGIRLVRVDVTTGLEIPPGLALSPAASPGTLPTGLAIGADAFAVYGTCRSDGGDRFFRVRLDTFTEVDLDATVPGTQGTLLADGAGPLTPGNPPSLMMISPTPAPFSLLTLANVNGGRSGYDSAIVGSPENVVFTAEHVWVLQGLSGFAGDQALTIRPASNAAIELTRPVSDDVGGVPTGATSLHVLVQFAGAPRLLGVFDTDLLVTFAYDGFDVTQEDLDAATPGVQGLDLGATLADLTAAAFLPGAYAP
jgi:hypothetical protein